MQGTIEREREEELMEDEERMKTPDISEDAFNENDYIESKN